ncbi:MAG TPA: histidine kinase [Acidimicrobiales bacterium]|nr:histidine kinase [Acidimicrobiales bacterium]
MAVAAWLGGRVCLERQWPRLLAVSVLVLALAGGALASLSSVAIVFMAVAALAATLRWRIETALALVVAAPLSLVVSAPGAGTHVGAVVGGLAATLTGAILGISRREARAELLAGRNHLARELHDVLAHTLSALSLQLEALGAIMGGGQRPEVREQLEATKRLVRESLGEARGAVLALREDGGPLEEQLAKLAGERRATLTVEGSPRSLPADVVLALFRVAQEALTNVVKHAPGATACVTLGYGPSALTLSVENGPPVAPPPATLAEAGAGFGLQGIRERMLLIGGRVDAGPHGTGWRVEAEVPA